MERRDVNWTHEGETMSGHLYVPEGAGPFPAVVLCHGFAGVKELLLPAYAERFATAGYLALTFDYRGFGASGGERGRLVPALQIADIRSALSFLGELPRVDPRRLALWGSSYGGANAIMVASQDPRVRCLVVQLTFGDGERVITRGMSPEEVEKLKASLARLEEKRALTGRELMVPLKKVLTDPQSSAFYDRHIERFPELGIKVPFLTTAETLRHKPEAALPGMNVPLLIVGAELDGVNPPEESRRLFAAANPPKELLMIEGATHYELYEGPAFELALERELAWFGVHL